LLEGHDDGSRPAVTPRPAQPEPFLRGAPYPASGDVPYPRANPADTARLPSDTWHAAIVPVGVRLEVVGDAEAIDIAYRTTSGNLGYRGDGAGITFSVWRAGRKVGEEEAVLGDGLIRVPLGSGAADKPATIYLPEGMQPLVQSLTAVKEERSARPRTSPGGSPTGTRSRRGGSHRDRPRVGPPSPPARPAWTWPISATPPPDVGRSSRPSTSPTFPPTSSRWPTGPAAGTGSRTVSAWWPRDSWASSTCSVTATPPPPSS
jgi:hypothetical protein